LVKPKLIDQVAKQPTKLATPQPYSERTKQTHSHTSQQGGGKEMERQSTPYPNIDLADIDDDDEQSTSYHLLQMSKTSCHNNPISHPHSSCVPSKLTLTRNMEKPEEGDFEFTPQENRTSTPYPDEHYYASDETTEY
jgi:hypothetical protein